MNECDDVPRELTIGRGGAGRRGVLGDVGDSISRRNERGVFVCDLVLVIRHDGGNVGRLDCMIIGTAPVVFVGSILDGLVNPAQG